MMPKKKQLQLSKEYITRSAWIARLEEGKCSLALYESHSIFYGLQNHSQSGIGPNDSTSFS